MPQAILMTAHKIWIYDVERQTLTRMTFEGANSFPGWSPDGRWVTFGSLREGKYGIYRAAADKSGPPELLLETDAGPSPASWTPDGKTLIYTQTKEGKTQWAAPTGGGDGKARLFSQTSFNEEYPQLSPNGKWLAYESDESGKV